MDIVTAVLIVGALLCAAVGFIAGRQQDR